MTCFTVLCNRSRSYYGTNCDDCDVTPFGRQRPHTVDNGAYRLQSLHDTEFAISQLQHKILCLIHFWLSNQTFAKGYLYFKTSPAYVDYFSCLLGCSLSISPVFRNDTKSVFGFPRIREVPFPASSHKDCYPMSTTRFSHSLYLAETGV